MQDALFASFFVVNDKIQGHLGTLGPLEVGRLLAVAQHVTAAVMRLGIILVIGLEPSLGHVVVVRHGKEMFGPIEERGRFTHQGGSRGEAAGVRQRPVVADPLSLV